MVAIIVAPANSEWPDSMLESHRRQIDIYTQSDRQLLLQNFGSATTGQMSSIMLPGAGQQRLLPTERSNVSGKTGHCMRHIRGFKLADVLVTQHQVECCDGIVQLRCFGGADDRG